MAEDIANKRNFKKLPKNLKYFPDYHFENKISQIITECSFIGWLLCGQNIHATKIIKNISAFKKSSIEETSDLIINLYTNLSNTLKRISNIEKDWNEILDNKNKNIPASAYKLSGVIGIATKKEEKVFQSETECSEIIRKIQAQKCPASFKIPPYAASYDFEKIDHDFSNQKIAGNKYADSLKTDVLVAGLNKNIGIEDLLDFFRDSHPGIVLMPRWRGGKKKGFAIITFPTFKDAKNASRLNSQRLMGSIISVQVISNENLIQEIQKNYTIHVQNLHYHTSDESISRFFRRNGVSVECMRIPHYPSGQNKGFGFVVLSNKSDFERALKLDDLELEGRKLRIEVAN